MRHGPAELWTDVWLALVAFAAERVGAREWEAGSPADRAHARRRVGRYRGSEVDPGNTESWRGRSGTPVQFTDRGCPGPTGRTTSRSPSRYATESLPQRAGSAAPRASGVILPSALRTHRSLGVGTGHHLGEAGSPSSTAKDDSAAARSGAAHRTRSIRRRVRPVEPAAGPHDQPPSVRRPSHPFRRTGTHRQPDLPLRAGREVQTQTLAAVESLSAAERRKATASPLGASAGRDSLTGLNVMAMGLPPTPASA